MGTPIIIVINSYGLAKPFEEAGCTYGVVHP